jgi:hypothetical protein
MIIRLAKSGPKIQINIEPEESPVTRQFKELQKAFAQTNSDQAKDKGDSNKDTVVNEQKV